MKQHHVSQAASVKRLRASQTAAERILWSRLRGRQLVGTKFRRQHSLGPYIVDFVSLENKLIVEVDGGQHNSDDGTRKDERRTDWLQKQGYQILRFWNSEVHSNIEGVLHRIAEALRQGVTLT